MMKKSLDEEREVHRLAGERIRLENGQLAQERRNFQAFIDAALRGDREH